MMTGDISAFSDTTVALPAILMSLAYSRDLEREAEGAGWQRISDMLSSHQVTSERIRRFEQN